MGWWMLWFCCHIEFIVNFRFIAGYLGVFRCNSLIINTIHFFGRYAFAGRYRWLLHTLGSVGCCANAKCDAWEMMCGHIDSWVHRVMDK